MSDNLESTYTGMHGDLFTLAIALMCVYLYKYVTSMMIFNPNRSFIYGIQFSRLILEDFKA
jgi:hypothetical protein